MEEEFRGKLAECLGRELATIERCAQVAENHMKGTVGRDYGAEIAAAIRKLKDETKP